MHLGKLDTALEIAQASGSEAKWRQLGELALAAGKLQVRPLSRAIACLTLPLSMAREAGWLLCQGSGCTTASCWAVCCHACTGISDVHALPLPPHPARCPCGLHAGGSPYRRMCPAAALHLGRAL